MSAYPMSTCPMCDEYLHEDAPSVLVGDDTLHDYCADYGDVTKCAFCNVREYTENVDATWGHDGRKDRVCPACEAEREHETAEEALASAVPVNGLRPTEITTLARMIRAVTE